MQKIVILDFGSQTTQLIGRRVRELGTFCEILPYNKFPSDDTDIIGVILSGSPLSVYADDSFHPDLSNIIGRWPLLGICYGAQLLSHSYGGKVEPVGTREYGRAMLNFIDVESRLFKGITTPSQVWMSHGDSITAIPEGYELSASTDSVHFAAFESKGKEVWGVQFHPEVEHSLIGRQLLENFVVGICGSRQQWSADSFIDKTVGELREQLGDDKVVLGLSGGVDSSVAAVLLNKAIGERLTCIFVNHGLLRKNEFEDVLEDYKCLGLNVVGVDAKARFYNDLACVEEPESKRKIIGADFIKVFDEEASKIEDVKWLAQGTIYPDRIESLNITGKTIKSHHNVGGLPEDLKFGLVEPLKYLYKFEVREVGAELGLDHYFLDRHPFPGPGLGVRCLEELTPERIHILQEADAVFIDALRREGLYDKIWQAAVVLLPVRSTGITDGRRTYDNVVALRAVNSVDAVTAEVVKLPMDFLISVSQEIIEKVDGVNRVVYDCSPKPPATIEWE